MAYDFKYKRAPKLLTGSLEMTNVFVSYAKKDRILTEVVSRALERGGLAVWWDRLLNVGDDWERIIESQIGISSCVVLLLTHNSAQGGFVAREIELAKEQKKQIFPLLCIQDPHFQAPSWCPIQWEDLSRWNGLEDDPPMRSFVERIRKFIEQQGTERERQAWRIDWGVGDKARIRRRKTVLESVIDASFAPEMVLIPNDPFVMGQTPSADGVNEEFEGKKVRRLEHLCRLRAPLLVGRYPVTFDQWDAVVDQSKIKLGVEIYKPADKFGRGKQPVTNVSWHDVQMYCDYLSELTGYDYRLLSETEWEYACRAGTSSDFGISARDLDKIAYDARTSWRESPKRKTKPDEIKPFPVDYGGGAPNAFRICGMHGGVWEWVEDEWHETFTEGAKPSNGDPWSAPMMAHASRKRVVRGGCFKSLPQHISSYHRNWRDARHRDVTIGFRVARQIHRKERSK